MPIECECPGCHARYRVNDAYVGRSTTCKKCGNTITISAVDTSPLPARYSSVSTRSDLSSRGGQSAVAEAPAMPQTFAAPLGAPKRSFSAAGITQPLFNDSVTKTISIVVVILSLLSVLVSLHKAISINAAVDYSRARPEIQDELKAQVVAGVVVAGVGFFLLITPAVFIGAAVGSSASKKDTFPQDAVLRSCAVAALTILVPQFFASTEEQRRVLVMVSPVIALPAIRELMHYTWRSTFLTWFVCLFTVFGALYATKALTQAVDPIVAPKIAKLKEEFDQRFKPRPMAPPQVASIGPSQARVEPKPSALSDPLVARWGPMLPRADDALKDTGTLTQEQLAERFKPFVELFDQQEMNSDSPTWGRMAERVGRMKELTRTAPSREPPAVLYQPLTDAFAMTKAPADDEILGDEVAIGNVRVRPLKEARIDLSTYSTRNRTLAWILPSAPGARVSLSVIARRDPKQIRPWVSDKPVIATLAKSHKLYHIDTPAMQEMAVEMNGLLMQRLVPDLSVSQTGERRFYIAAVDNQFIELQIKHDRPQDMPALNAMEAMARSIRITDQGATADPFALDQIIPLLNDDFENASPIVFRYGEAAEEPVLAWLKASNKPPTEPMKALLRKIGTRKSATYLAAYETAAPAVAVTPVGAGDAAGAGAAPIPPAEKPIIPVRTVLEKFALEIDPNVRMDMLLSLTRQPVDSNREEISQLLEQILLTPNQDAYVSAAGGALAVWYRPQTIDLLLPMLEEGIAVPQRQAAMTALAGTKDLKAVRPTLRWMIKDPDLVVASLIALGPVAEPEVIKLLREPDQNVRRNAARVLEQIGTSRSVVPLKNASSAGDPIAGVAKQALAAVAARRASGGK